MRIVAIDLTRRASRTPVVVRRTAKVFVLQWELGLPHRQYWVFPSSPTKRLILSPAGRSLSESPSPGSHTSFGMKSVKHRTLIFAFRCILNKIARMATAETFARVTPNEFSPLVLRTLATRTGHLRPLIPSTWRQRFRNPV